MDPLATAEPLGTVDAPVAAELLARLDEPLGAVRLAPAPVAVAAAAVGVDAATLAGDVVVAGAAVGVACVAELQAEITRIALAPYTRRRIHRPWDFTMCSSSNDSRSGSPRPQIAG